MKIIVGVTGASGGIYAFRLVQELIKHRIEVHLVISRSGEMVLKHENIRMIESCETDKNVNINPLLKIYAYDNLFAPPASGSFLHDGMIIVPCSMKTLGAISAGLSDNLIQRAADVCLKEKRKLIIVPRETPLSVIHLKNMLELSHAGAILLPACPGFYYNPKTIDDLVDFIVVKILNLLDIKHDLIPEWGYNL